MSTIDVGKWLENHHRIGGTQRDGGEVVHVYAIAGPPVYGSNTRSWDFNIEIPLWGVTWGLSGSIDLDSLSIDATFTAKVPFLPTFTLGQVKGSLKDGVSIEFGISGILSGKATFYAKNGWLVLDLSATVFGSTYGPLTIQLIPLPWWVSWSSD